MTLHGFVKLNMHGKFGKYMQSKSALKMQSKDGLDLVENQAKIRKHETIEAGE